MQPQWVKFLSCYNQIYPIILPHHLNKIYKGDKDIPMFKNGSLALFSLIN